VTRDRSDDTETVATLVGGRAAFVWRRQIADTDTPVSAALALIEPGRGDFLLESVEGGQTRGRHSLIGLAPDLIFRARGDAADVNGEPVDGAALSALRALVARCRA
jgi:anthranilate synthase component 1